MNKKEQFLTAVFCGALAHDLRNETSHAQTIARVASEIDEARIPPNPIPAAAAFLRFCLGHTDQPFKWMLLGATEAIQPKRSHTFRYVAKKIADAKSAPELRLINDKFIIPLDIDRKLTKDEVRELERISQERYFRDFHNR